MTRVMTAPEWSAEDTGTRVLVEATDGLTRDVVTRILTREGYAVRGCEGPEASDNRCPLTEGRDCAGITGADVVVQVLRHTDPRTQEVLIEIKRHRPDLPVVVEVAAPTVDRNPELFEDCRILPQPMTAMSLVEAVKAALAD
jgi:DNA-binding NtrC family response regulator